MNQKQIKNAKFKDHLRLTDLTSTADYGLKDETLASLTSLNWVTKCCNVIISGSCGVGKTGLACALGYNCCSNGISVRYYRTSDLLLELTNKIGMDKLRFMRNLQRFNVNPDFIKISGFTEEELLGQPHNIVRHPDMPPAAFEHMWSTLKSGRSWMGLVKNRCKNGDHYWVSAYVTPIAKNGSIVEYQSVRTKPEPEQVLAAEKLYTQLRSGKAARPKLAASFSVKILLLIWGSIISSAMAAGMLTDTSISSLLLPGINAFTRCRSLTSIALSGSRIVTANQTDS